MAQARHGLVLKKHVTEVCFWKEAVKKMLSDANEVRNIKINLE